MIGERITENRDSFCLACGRELEEEEDGVCEICVEEWDEEDQPKRRRLDD